MEGHLSFRRSLRNCLLRRASDLMQYVWLTAGILSLVYYGIIALYAGPDADFAWFWIALGAAFLLAFGRYVLVKTHPGLWPAMLHRVYLTALCTGLAVMAVFCIPVVRYMDLPLPEDADYVIVLGAQVRKTAPSRALLRRLEKALECAERMPDAKLILSGGKGSGEEIAEAECMRRYLTEHGVREERLILEDKSTTTRENLIFSDRLTGCAQSDCGILSNDFHVYRALRIAEKLGYRDAAGIDAQGDPVMELHYIVRESAALIAGKLSGSL